MTSDPEYYAHESVYIDEPVSVGTGTKIWHYSHIMSGAVIGKNCLIGQSVFVGSRARIGDFVKVQNNVSVYDEVTLEDYVFCGPSVVFTNDKNPRAKYPKQGVYLPTVIKYGASLGANSTIICGHTLGKWAFVGAGAVVSCDVPDYAMVVGNPARVKGWMCECGENIFFQNSQAVCSKCNSNYSKNADIVEQIQ